MIRYTLCLIQWNFTQIAAFSMCPDFCVFNLYLVLFYDAAWLYTTEKAPVAFTRTAGIRVIFIKNNLALSVKTNRGDLPCWLNYWLSVLCCQWLLSRSRSIRLTFGHWFILVKFTHIPFSKPDCFTLWLADFSHQNKVGVSAGIFIKPRIPFMICHIYCIEQADEPINCFQNSRTNFHPPPGKIPPNFYDS